MTRRNRKYNRDTSRRNSVIERSSGKTEMGTKEISIRQKIKKIGIGGKM